MKSPGSIACADHILHLAWDRGGERLMAVPASGEIVLMDCGAAKVGELPGHAMGNGCADWFRGEPATCGFDGAVRWGGREWKPGRGMIERVKADPGENFLAAAQGRALHVFGPEGDTGRGIANMPVPASDFAWNPAKPDEIATAGAGGALLWRLGEAEPFARFDWGGACLLVDWSSDGRWIATGDQTPSVHVYDIPRDHSLHIQGFESKVRAMAFSPDGKKLATAGSPVVTVWPCTGKKGPEGAKPIQVDGCESEVAALAFSPATGQLAVGDGKGTLLVVTFEAGQFRRKRARLDAGISALAWHPSRALLGIGFENGEAMLLSLE